MTLAGASGWAIAVVMVLAAASGAGADSVVLEGLDGGRLSDLDLEEGSTIVVVWASWSPRCRGVIARINSLVERWTPSARVVTVAVRDKPPAVRRFVAGRGLRSQVFLDPSGAFSKKHAVTTLPGLLLFRGGRRAFAGALPRDADPLIARHLD